MEGSMHTRGPDGLIGCKGQKGFRGPREPGLIGAIDNMIDLMDDAMRTEHVVDCDGNSVCDISPYTLIEAKALLQKYKELAAQYGDHL